MSPNPKTWISGKPSLGKKPYIAFFVLLPVLVFSILVRQQMDGLWKGHLAYYDFRARHAALKYDPAFADALAASADTLPGSGPRHAGTKAGLILSGLYDLDALSERLAASGDVRLQDIVGTTERVAAMYRNACREGRISDFVVQLGMTPKGRQGYIRLMGRHGPRE